MAATTTSIFLLAAAAAVLVAAQGAFGAQLRSLRDIKFPKSLEACMELHSEAKRRARMTEQQHGHYHEPIAAAPTAPYRPTAALSTPNTAILPSDFGADRGSLIGV